MRLLFIGLIFAVVCSSCQSKKEQSSYSVQGEVDYILQDSLTVKMPDMIDSVRYIKLETNELCLLGDIKKLELYEGKIFIQDANGHLYVFDDAGHFLNKIGVRGRGPEEYLGMINFYLDKKNKWVGVMDASDAKIVTYDFKGEFVKKTPVHKRSFWYIMNAGLYKGFLFVYNNCYHQVIYSARIYDAETINSNMVLNPYPMNRMANSGWSRHPFAETGEGITFIKPHSDTLFHFDGISVKPTYVIEHTYPLASQHIFDVYNEGKPGDLSFGALLQYLAAQDYFQNIMQVYETSAYIWISYMSGRGQCSHILWNKNLKKGGFAGPCIEIEKKDVYRDFINKILSSNEDCFITVYGYSDIEDYKFMSARGYRLDPGMQQILTEWNEDDNPVVALYYMKKEGF